MNDFTVHSNTQGNKTDDKVVELGEHQAPLPGQLIARELVDQFELGIMALETQLPQFEQLLTLAGLIEQYQREQQQCRLSTVNGEVLPPTQQQYLAVMRLFDKLLALFNSPLLNRYINQLSGLRAMLVDMQDKTQHLDELIKRG